MSLRDALNIPASEITDETVYRERRRLLAALAAAPALGLAGCAEAEPPPPTKVVITPEQARSGFRTTETLTRFEDITTYNNFY
jgi:sulfoxide reductase catalytic subunit YedY